MRRDIGYRMICVFLATMFAIPLSACNLAEDIRNNVEERIVVQGDISEQELTRLIISAIDNRDECPDAYSGIPKAQKGGLSYSYFYEYIDILRTISRQDGKGKINSFRMLDSNACLSLLGQELFDRYGQIIGAELLYTNDSEFPVYIFYSLNDDGTAALSSEWITSIIDIYNYCSHYFTMLDEGNADGVQAILSPGLASDAYTDEAVYARAQKLCEFYRLRVKSTISEYEITGILPDCMTVRIPETVASDGVTFEEHIVELTLLDSGSFHIDDRISMSSDFNLVYLTRGDERLVRIGNEYSYDDISSLIGEPMSVSVNEETGIGLIIYQGTVLRFDNVRDDGNSWSGTLTSVRLYGSSIFSIGYNLYVGMTKTQLLVSYPFIDDNDFEISLENGNNLYYVTFDFSDDDKADSIRITV